MEEQEREEVEQQEREEVEEQEREEEEGEEKALNERGVTCSFRKHTSIS